MESTKAHLFSACQVGLALCLACSDKQATSTPSGGSAGGVASTSAGSGGSGAVPVSSGGRGGDASAGEGAATIGDAGASAAGATAVSQGTLAGGNACPLGEFGDPLTGSPSAELIHDGRVGFLEGPVWLAQHGKLYYTNFAGTGGDGRIRSYEPNGALQDVFIEGIGANGLAVDGAGRFVAGFHQEQRVLRIDPATKQYVPVPGGDRYMGLPLNSVNDVIARSDGHIYFTDPTYQRGARPGQPENRAYHLTPDGVLTAIDAQEAPNGIALSPDGRTLYVAGSGNVHPLLKYELLEDGSVVKPGRKISDLPSDGIAVDCAGNLYLTTGGGSNGNITLLSPDGELLGTLPIRGDSGTTNAAFGGSDYKTLFVTTNSGGLFRISMTVPGLP